MKGLIMASSEGIPTRNPFRYKELVLEMQEREELVHCCLRRIDPRRSFEKSQFTLAFFEGPDASMLQDAWKQRINKALDFIKHGEIFGVDWSEEPDIEDGIY